MATFQNATVVKQFTHAAFDKVYSPGETPPFGGIYRCEGCGHEIASNKGVQLPSQNHHQHSPLHGKIRWRLTVYAETK